MLIKGKIEILKIDVSRIKSSECFTCNPLFSRYLDMSLDSSEVRRQDGTYVIIYVSHNSVGRDLAWNFVKANFEQLLEMYVDSPNPPPPSSPPPKQSIVDYLKSVTAFRK